MDRPPTIPAGIPTDARCRRQADSQVHWPTTITTLADQRVLKQSEAGLVVAGTTSVAGAIVVKIRRLPGLKGTLRALLGLTPMARAWRTASRLHAVGIATAQPIALLAGTSGRERVEVLVLPEIAGRTLLARLADRDLPEAVERLAAANIADMIAQLARHRLANRDHKPSNIIISDTGRPVLLDAELRTAPPAEAAARMLASLAIEPSGVGITLPRVPTARVLRLVASRLADQGVDCSARDLRDAAAAIVNRHGDPTPKANQLAPPDKPE